MLNNNPPLAQKILRIIILVLFSYFSLGMKPDDIPLLQGIRDYNCRFSSHADDPLVFLKEFCQMSIRIPVGLGRAFKSGKGMTY